MKSIEETRKDLEDYIKDLQRSIDLSENNIVVYKRRLANAWLKLRSLY